jgi:hypothetical protein
MEDKETTIEERLDTEQSLSENRLNDLDNESENDNHVSEPKPSPEQCQPVEAKEFVLLEMGDYKIQLGSCYYNSITLSNQALLIYNQIKEAKKNEQKSQSYLG